MTDTTTPEHTVSDGLLSLWAEQLETPAGRELLSRILCRTMSAVAGEGCVSVCPMKAAAPELARVLDLAAQQASAIGDLAAKLQANIEGAEFTLEKAVS